MTASTPDPPEWLSLGDGERVWVRAEPSSNLVLGSLITGVVLLLAMSMVVGFFTDLATGRAVSFAVLMVILLLLAAAYLVIRRREYVLTNERAYAGVGLTDKRVSSVELADVSDVTVEQSNWQQLLNVGNLRFDADGGDVEFALVENPAGVYRRVLQYVDLDPGAG